MKKLYYLLFLVAGILLIGLFGCPNLPPAGNPIPTDTPAPTAVSTPEPSKLVAGTIWLDPETITVNKNADVALKVMVNTGSDKLAAYGIKINYDSSILSVNTAVGTSGVEAGADGYVAAVNPNDAGILVTSGFDTGGKGPSLSLHIFTANFTALKSGKSTMQLQVNTLTNEAYATIGTPAGREGTVIVH